MILLFNVSVLIREVPRTYIFGRGRGVVRFFFTMSNYISRGVEYNWTEDLPPPLLVTCLVLILKIYNTMCYFNNMFAKSILLFNKYTDVLQEAREAKKREMS